MDRFAALADPNRRRIVELLAQRGQLSSSDIHAHFAISHPAISQHLKVLLEADLVVVERQGQQRLYRLNPDGLDTVAGWAARLAQLWNDRFDALDELLQVEKTKQRKEKDEPE